MQYNLEFNPYIHKPHPHYPLMANVSITITHSHEIVIIIIFWFKLNKLTICFSNALVIVEWCS